MLHIRVTNDLTVDMKPHHAAGLDALAGMQEAVEKIAAIYESAGAKEKFFGRFYDVPHKFTRPMQEDAFAWLDRQLSV